MIAASLFTGDSHRILEMKNHPLPLSPSLLCALAVALTWPLSLWAGGSRSIAEIPEAAAFYTTEKAEGAVGKSVRLEVAWVTTGTTPTPFGEATLTLHTFIENVPGGRALLVAPEAELEKLTSKYGTEEQKGKSIRTRSLRAKFAGLDGKTPVFVVE